MTNKIISQLTRIAVQTQLKNKPEQLKKNKTICYRQVLRGTST